MSFEALSLVYQAIEALYTVVKTVRANQHAAQVLRDEWKHLRVTLAGRARSPARARGRDGRDAAVVREAEPREGRRVLL
jgi:hypothetical protein